MTDTYDAGEHNSMHEPFLEYDSSYQKQSPESLEKAIEQSRKLREKMEELHIVKPQVNIWAGIA